MNQDFRDLLAEFNAHGVEYIVVGAHCPSRTWSGSRDQGLGRLGAAGARQRHCVIAALQAFGAPLHDLTESDLAVAGTIFQIGVAPIRIDVITAIDGVDFTDAWARRLQAPFADQFVPNLSREHLIQNKRAAGREQDLLDVKWLERHPPKQ